MVHHLISHHVFPSPTLAANTHIYVYGRVFIIVDYVDIIEK